MKIVYKIFIAAIFTIGILSPNLVRAINPLYQLQANNFALGGSGTFASNNTLEFDITIWHTNPDSSGAFTYASGDYYLNFNPAVANGGILTFTIIPNSSEFIDPRAIPISASITGSILRILKRDTLPINPPVISTVFPGTRVIRVKLATTAPSFANLSLDLAWRDSTFGDPYTKISAFIDGVNTDITRNGTFIVNNDPPLPVELSILTSNVIFNRVTLNWATDRETNNSGFEIERSNDVCQNWIKTGFVKGNGTTNDSKTYSFSENINSGNYNYRLKQIDFNGNFEYFYLTNMITIGTPASYSLSQNYPNPFNPETNINYEVAFDGAVNITLYDVDGREITKLVNEVQQAGYYSIRFNAAGLNSGVYFYKISAGNGIRSFVLTKRMILLK